jgi:ribose transport system substrate-binding protein
MFFYKIPLLLLLLFNFAFSASLNEKKIVYIASDMSIPFWQIISKGIKQGSKEYAYDLEIYNSENTAKKELELVTKAIKDKVDGIIISPTNSSACVTVLKLASNANIPVVIADIGTDSGEYLSYISSNNQQGAYEIGKVLTSKMQELGFEEGKVGIIAIPQKRLNGQARTQGFMKALNEASIKGANIVQQTTFSLEETYLLSKALIAENPDLKAIWLQGSDKYEGALKAIYEAGKKEDILLVTFDAEPIFLELIPQEVLLGAAMQQPFLMGEEAVKAFYLHFNQKSVTKNTQLPILAISSNNIKTMLPIIRRNVLGQHTK